MPAMRTGSTRPAVLLGLSLCLTAVPAPAQEGLVTDTLAATRPPDVIFVPTPPEVVDAMLRVAGVNSRDTLYDLGSGDGRIVIAAAKQFGATGVGIEIDRIQVLQARANAKRAGVSDRVTFLRRDLFTTDIGPATVVTLYLLPGLNERLRPVLLTLRPGTRIVSHAYGMGPWKPDTQLAVGSRTVLFWTVPAHASGEWVWKRPGHAGDQSTALIAQEYQRLEGSVTEGEDTLPITSGRVKGDSVTFIAGREDAGGRAARRQFSGRIRGDTITGFVRDLGSPHARAEPWRAKRISRERANGERRGAP